MPYRRLPGKKRGLYRKNTLWLGDDHLLAVESNYYTEEYRRFPFREIQAVVLRRTTYWRNVSLALSVPIFFLGGAVVVSLQRGYQELVWFWGILFGLLLLILLVHLAQGPTCDCRLQMPLGTTNLPSLHRLRTARRTLRRLREKIAHTQGLLAPEEIPRSAPAVQQPLPSTAPAPQGRGAGSRQLHAWLFALLAGNALLGGAEMLWNLSPFNPLQVLLLATLVGLALLALVRQNAGTFSGGTKIVTWCVAGFLGLCLTVGYFVMMFGAMTQLTPERMHDQWQIYLLMREVVPDDHPVLAAAIVGQALLSLLLAIIGLTLLVAGGRKRGSV